jgi:Ni,Fe-hydrogenase I large subunit
MGKVIIDPLPRIEGHLRIDTRVEDGRVVEAWSKGEMFRGFEALLVGRGPLDAPPITQRICGVCPVSHTVASCKAVEAALGLKVPANGDYLRNLVLGANYLQSHILHFYQLSALDFVNIEALRAYEGRDPVLREVKAEALEIRQEAHRMAAMFGGKRPHPAALIHGGVTCGVDAEAVDDFRMRLARVKRFVANVYLPGVLAAARLFPDYARTGRGVPNFLAFGVFDEGDSPWLPGARIADRTAESLRQIVQGVDKVTDLVAEIAAANEQAQGIAQVNVGLNQVDQVNQKNTATAEESAAAAEELSSQAQQLRQMLARFVPADTPAMLLPPGTKPAVGWRRLAWQ